MATAGRRVHLMRPHQTCDHFSRSTRPFHEAVDRRARRARHSRQVFGLAGTRSSWIEPTGRRFPGGCPVHINGGRSCLPLRDSPGFSPGSLSLRQPGLTELRRQERSSGLLMTAPGEPAALPSIGPRASEQEKECLYAFCRRARRATSTSWSREGRGEDFPMIGDFLPFRQAGPVMPEKGRRPGT